ASRRSRAPRSRSAARRTRTGTAQSSARPAETAGPRARRPRARRGPPPRAARAPPSSARRSQCHSLALHLVPHKAIGTVVVDDADRLHGGVHGRGADEAEAALAEPFGQLYRLSGLRVPLVRDGPVAPVLPHELMQRRRVAKRDRRLRVGDRGLDLAPVTDDSRVPEQPLAVLLAEPRNGIRLEVRECMAEVLALAQDGQPGEAGLEALEAQPLENTRLIRDRTTPLEVVVVVVRRISRFPTALHTSTLTIPSSTRTGKVSTGSKAGSDSGSPVRRSKLEPCRGHTTVRSSGSQSPSQSGPSSCEQRSS